MQKILLFAAALFALSPVAVSAQGEKLSPAEQKISATADAEILRTIALLERMVNQNSGSLNPDGVRKVRDMVIPEFEELGFTVRWVDMGETGRAGHLIAEHKGNGKGKRMLLIGHLDTVFEPDSPFQTYTRNGDSATGPGVADDKGGVAVIIAALRAMKTAGTLKNADIRVVLTGDEEDAGNPIEIARRDLVAAGKWADVALDFEGLASEDGKDMGSIARRSSDTWTVRVKAKSGHSSGIFRPEMGDGAIYAIADIISDFRTELPEPNLTFNTGLILGGGQAEVNEAGIAGTASGKTNIIAADAVAKGDIRTLAPEQLARVKSKMTEIVARARPGVTSAEVVFDPGGYPPMAPTDGGRALLARLNSINVALGLPQMEVFDPLKRGAGDIGFVAADTDGLVGLGPDGYSAHAVGETVDINSFPRQIKRAAILMTRLSMEKR